MLGANLKKRWLAVNIKLLKIIISILFGICLGLYFNIALFICFFIIVIGIIKYFKLYIKYIILSILIFVIIILGEQKYKKIYDNINELDTNFTCICRVISNVEEKEYTNKYIVRIEESSSFIFEKIKIILYRSLKKY